MNIRIVDWYILLPTLWLGFISSMILISYSWEIGVAHLIALSLGLFGFFLMKFFPRTLFEKFYLVFAGLGVLLLVITLMFGATRGGATRWLSIGEYGFQPGELVKFIYIFFLGYVFTLSDLRKRYLYAIVWGSVYFVLIALQPDLDTALTFLCLFMILFFYQAPFQKVFLPAILIAGVVLVGVLPLAWRYTLKDYQKERVLTFMQPTRDPLGSGYHANQALISVGRGGLVGTGIGKGTQFRNNFLPEHTTDFAFASISEELGLFGAGSVLMAVSLIIWRLLWIAIRVADVFVKSICVSVAGLMGIHLLMNVGMNLGVVPVMGITLPFISYGGSSIVVFFCLLGYASAQYVAWRRIS